MMILLGLGPSTVAAPPDQEGSLFADAATAGYADSTDDPTIVRTRFVEPNLDLLGGTGGSPVADVLELNLFDDTAFTAVLDHAESNPSGSLSWMGHLEGVEHGSAVLVVKDRVMVGSIKMPGAFYQIRYVGDGVHAIHEMNPGAFPPEMEPVSVAASEDAPVEAFTAPTADDGSTIDVLVVYTDDARAAVGGTTAMENLIDLAVAETNTSYANSGITQRVNLAHAAKVSYDETDLDWSTTLSRLRLTSDGYLDIVHTLRDSYCADEVVLIINDNASCGLGYLMTSVSTFFADRAFALVYWSCATGYYSFGHEMGHNMGATHDRANTSNSGAYSYSYGYQAPDKAFRTIMAYSCPGGCTRIDYWSNPDVSYGGQPTGVVYTAPDSADNRRTLNNTAFTVANFRDSSVCVPSTYNISGHVRDSSGSPISGVTVDFGGARPAVTTNSSGYYEQSDLDNGTYAVTMGRSGYVFSPVVDQVTVSSANATHNATGYTFNPASVPFYDDFESRILGSAWAVETDYEGRSRVGTYDPHWGRYSLLLDDDTDVSLYSHASAILALDLSGQSQVDMGFWWRDFGDEEDSDDGVFISDDLGATWHQAYSFSGDVPAYTQTVVHLHTAAISAGMSLNDHFLVKFQFYDNSPIGPTGSDGYGIDDVAVVVSTTVGPLVYVTHTVDDDVYGTSSGNDDGIVNCGENIELYVDLYNQGIGTFITPSITITTTDPTITFTGNTASDYSDIAGLGVGTNLDNFTFEMNPDMSLVHYVQFSLTISATNGGPWSDDFDVRVRCGSAYVYLPLVMRVYPLPVLTNGDFESGQTDWTEYSTHGWNLIMQTADLPRTPHSG
ncbi:MAG: M12 family metallo-peptidase, partial [Anaerolineae bacterium]